MPLNFFSRSHQEPLPDINIGETLAIIMAKRRDFVIRRIPDVSHPCFFVLSSAIAVFYVTIEDSLKIFAVMENKRSPQPFITSSRFNSSKISFKLGGHSLGFVISKEEVAWDVSKPTNEKMCEIVKNGDGLSCKIVRATDQQHIGVMRWESYWAGADNDVPIDLPQNTSFTLHYEIDLEATAKSLLLASTFTVHYAQKQIKPKKCTKKTVSIIGLAIFLLLISAAPLLFYRDAWK